MANTWRGYRPLVLDGWRFRWACSFNHPAERYSVGYAERGHLWPPDRLVVRPEKGPHRLLTVAWPACHGPVVLPSLVRACVDEGLRRGWLDTVPTLELDASQVAAPEPRTA